MEIITDQEISDYISEKKILPNSFDLDKILLRDKGTRLEFKQDVQGEEGLMFRIIVAVSKFDPRDFSVIFGLKRGNKIFKIRRYNGDHGFHRNKIEREEFDGCHIHYATERYQKNGFAEEGYAETTTKYENWKVALRVMLRENNFKRESDKDQKELEW